jgi:hypothetical protein
LDVQIEVKNLQETYVIDGYISPGAKRRTIGFEWQNEQNMMRISLANFTTSFNDNFSIEKENN